MSTSSGTDASTHDSETALTGKLRIEDIVPELLTSTAKMLSAWVPRSQASEMVEVMHGFTVLDRPDPA